MFWSQHGWEARNVELDDDKNQPKKQCLEIFCTNRYAPSLFGTKIRAIVVLLSSLAISGFFLSQALALEPSETDFKAQSFPDDSNIMRAVDYQARFEGSKANERYVAFVLGLGDDGMDAVDREDADPNNPQEIGDPVFLSQFPQDVSSTQGQMHLKQICQEFRQNELVAPYVSDGRDSGVSCWVDHFEAWLQEIPDSSAFPVLESDFLSYLSRFASIKIVGGNSSCSDEDCYAYHRTIGEFPSADPNSAWWWGTWDISLRFDKVNPGLLRGMIFGMNVTMEWDAYVSLSLSLSLSLSFFLYSTINTDRVNERDVYLISWRIQPFL